MQIIKNKGNTPTPYSVELIFDVPHTVLRMRNYRIEIQYDVGYSTVADFGMLEKISDRAKPWWNYRGTLELDNPKYKNVEGSVKNEIFISKDQYDSLKRLYGIGFLQNKGDHELMYGILTGKYCGSWSIASLAYIGVIPSEKDYRNIIFDNNSINMLNALLGRDAFLELLRSTVRDYGREGVHSILKLLSDGDEKLYYDCMASLSDPSSKELIPVVVERCVERLKRGENTQVKFMGLDDFPDLGRDSFEEAYKKAEAEKHSTLIKRLEAQGIYEEENRYRKLLLLEEKLEFQARIIEGRYNLMSKDGEYYYVDTYTGHRVYDNNSADRIFELMSREENRDVSNKNHSYGFER
jgi:hypothetical protein